MAGEPHINEILEKTRALLDDGGDWSARKEKAIAKVTTHALASGPVHRNDGSILQEAIVPLPDGDVLLTYLDVTDTAKYERVLRERNDALETAGRLKSEFIANVSHELRTPLNAVIGFADILTHQYFGNLNPRQLEYSHGILQSSQQLLGLINDNFDLAMIEAGHLVLEKGRVEVFKMLQTVLALTRARAGARQLEIEVRCPPDIGTITADERRLKQALFNLVSNAIKFTPPGGSIRLAAERRADELLLIVTDTGAWRSPARKASTRDAAVGRRAWPVIGKEPLPTAWGNRRHRCNGRPGNQHSVPASRVRGRICRLCCPGPDREPAGSLDDFPTRFARKRRAIR